MNNFIPKHILTDVGNRVITLDTTFAPTSLTLRSPTDLPSGATASDQQGFATNSPPAFKGVYLTVSFITTSTSMSTSSEPSPCPLTRAAQAACLIEKVLIITGKTIERDQTKEWETCT